MLTNREELQELRCGQCKYWGENCKRLDHKHLQFAVPWFKSYDCGQFCGAICKEFEPAPYCIWLTNHWTNIQDWMAAPIGEKEMVSLVIDGKRNTRYCVSYKRFFDGNFLDENGEPDWEYKKYYKIDRKSPIGYRLVREDRAGNITNQYGIPFDE